MYNNYNNDNFNNNPKPLFSNEFPEMNINVTNNQNSSINHSQDTPPALEPIKNLSDASIVNAPTLDVLGPMNIMPESFENQEPIKTDALDAYDNGINYESTISSPVSNNLFNPVPSISAVESVENNFAPSSVGVDIPSIDNNIGMSPTGFEIPGIVNYENNAINLATPATNNLNTPNFNTTIEQDNNELDNKHLINESVINNSSIEPTIDFNSNEEKVSEELVNENNSYEIIQEKIENENPMLNLGIDSASDDIDMLDIVDIDEENKEENNGIEEQEISEEDSNEEEKPLILDNIEEIKELINKIREKGVKIELEEFDFEHMYQLIVKIEK